MIPLRMLDPILAGQIKKSNGPPFSFAIRRTRHRRSSLRFHAEEVVPRLVFLDPLRGQLAGGLAALGLKPAEPHRIPVGAGAPLGFYFVAEPAG